MAPSYEYPNHPIDLKNVVFGEEHIFFIFLVYLQYVQFSKWQNVNLCSTGHNF